jgi:hypothetical protein
MYCPGVLTFDGGFMDSSFSRTKCITERLKTNQRQGCEYRVSPGRAQPRGLLSILKVIRQKRERWALVEIAQRFPGRGGRVLGVR